MKLDNRLIWSNILIARERAKEMEYLLNHEIIPSLTVEELDIKLDGSSNSNNLEETIQCFINYGEDKEILRQYFKNRVIMEE